MNKIDMTAVTTKAAELDFDIDLVQKELKRIASVKCRLKKMPGRPSFHDEMTRVLQEEQLLKNVREYINGPRKNVSTLTQEEVDIMTIDDVMKALKAIQSKKTHTKWLTDEPGNNDQYREACRIENMLKARRDALQPKNCNVIHKIDLQKMLDTLKGCSDLTAEECIRRIEEFMEVN